MPNTSRLRHGWLAARATLALLLAAWRYWSALAPVVKGELAHWRRRAGAIGDPTLRAVALTKLRDEGFTAETAAMLATLAPRNHRRGVVRAIVALEVAYDYLDGLTERPSVDPLSEGERLFAPFIGVFDDDRLGAPSRSDAAGDGGYLGELAATVNRSFGPLPAAGAVREIARAAAGRAAQAQTRMHAAPALGTQQAQEWAAAQASQTGLEWREFLAGAASSVIALHALLAAAADLRTTVALARELDAAYLSVSVLSTLLDSLIDARQDSLDAAGEFNELYESSEQVGDALVDVARRGLSQAQRLPGSALHVMMLAAVVAYFTTDPRARQQPAHAVVARLHHELGALILAPLLVMRAWRAARRLTRRVRRSGGGGGSSPPGTARARCR